MSHKITVFGGGYVGLVTGTCLADLGHDVLVADIDTAKVDQLSRGQSPIFEPGLQELLDRNIQAERLKFTTDINSAVHHGLLQFIAVGTPSAADGSADLSYVFDVARTIGQQLENPIIIVNKSTVPVGTAQQVQAIVQSELAKRNRSITFDVASNPEFLKQGSAIQDFMQPDRVIIGTSSRQAENLLKEIYAPLDDTNNKIICMDIASSELTKYAANAFLATKISFINEVSQIAEAVGANIDKVRVGIGTDPRISPKFLMPGCGFGGSCFPKDVRALTNIGHKVGVNTNLLQAVEVVNEAQKRLLFKKLNNHFNGDLSNKTIAVWGLAFKAGTDDMREASSCVLLEQLWQAGVNVQAYDPIAMPTAAKIYSQQPLFKLCASLKATLVNADALVIVTEWDEFRSPNFSLIKTQLKNPVIFDGRNLFQPEKMSNLGFDYYSIGRKQVGSSGAVLVSGSNTEVVN